MANCFIKVGAIVNQVATFAINDANLYEPVVTLSTQDDVKLLEQSKSSFKWTFNWNKHYPKATIQFRNNI